MLLLAVIAGAVFVLKDRAPDAASESASALEESRAAGAPLGVSPASAVAVAEVLAGGGAPPTTDPLLGVFEAGPAVEGPEGVASSSVLELAEPWNEPVPSVPEQRGWVSLLAEASPVEPVSLTGGVVDASPSPGSVTPVYWSVGRVSLLDADGVAVGGRDDEDSSPVTVELVADEGVKVSAAVSPVVVLDVVDSDSAATAGFQKVAFTVRVDGAGGLSAPGDVSAAESSVLQSGVDVRLTVDYSEFTDEYGANWAGRLRLVAFEPCALAETRSGCPGARVVAGFVNDVVSETLSVTMPLSDLVGGERGRSTDSKSSGTTSGFAMMAGSGSSSGEYATTSLNPSGSWAVGTQSGGFTWTYPFEAAAPPAGSAPGLSVTYSSSSIDGLTSDQNTQGGVLGPGWSLSEWFIERQYKACGYDGGVVADLCWYTDNATFSFAGMNSELIRVATEPDVGGYRPTVFRLESHSGWTVRRFAKVGATSRGDFGIDNDSEYWVATAPDGTQYWFGYGKEADGDGNPATTLQSVQTVPVVGNHAGEPCNTQSNNWCHQAYRWSLDRIEDPNGRVTTFHYYQEKNHYAILGSPGWSEPYVSGVVLVRVEYGQLASNANWTDWYTHSVTLTYQWRCDDPVAGLCQTAPTTANGDSFPDVPVDQLCDTASCSNYSPTFFVQRMLTRSTANVRDTTGTMVPISQEMLSYDWVDPDGTAANSDPARLWLDIIQHRGLRDGGNVWLPPVRFFESAALGNRVDHDVAGGVTEMLYYRVGFIIDEYGAQVNVGYTRTKVCPTNIGTSPPAGWGGWTDNTWSCFARWWVPPSGPAGWSAWHKYVVGSVAVIDQAGSQQAAARGFDYEYPQASATSGGMAWHSDDNPFIPVSQRGWSEFRGFEWVRLTVGHVNEANRVMTDYTFHRGMSGDINSHSNPVPGATVNTPSSLGNVVDADQLAGREREVIVRDVNPDGTAGTSVFSAVVTDYNSWSTDAGYGVSWQVEVQRTRSRASYNSVVRYGRVDYTYDSHAWMRRLSQVSDLGRVDSAYTNAPGDDLVLADDSCAAIVYTPSGGRFANGLPWWQRTYGNWDCDPAAALDDVRTYFDNSVTPTASSAPAPGVAPVAGNPTAVWRATGGGIVDEACSCAPAGIVERTIYGNNGYHATSPSWGRVANTIDARGVWTSVAYVAWGGYAFGARTVTVTNTLGHDVVTEFDLYGDEVRTIDPNNRSTWLCRDPLGRVTSVYLPDVSGGSTCTALPSITYTYFPTTGAANQATPEGVDVTRWAIQTRELFAVDADSYNPQQTGDSYLESWTLFDGFGRPAQTLAPSPAGGRVVVRTRYDSQDNPVRVSQPFHTAVAPSSVWSVLADNQIPREAFTTFDEVGRPLSVEQLDNNVSIYTQVNTYSPASESSWVQRDTGGPTVYGRTVRFLDADGNTWRVQEDSNAGVNTQTNYRYDQAGNLLSITDHGNNVTTMTYNRLGWRTSLDDPDAGYSETQYYPTGQIRYTVDAKNQVLYTRIDALGRPIAVYSSLTYSSANQLHGFNWDGTWQSMTGVVGLLTTADSYQASGAPNVETRTRITAVDTAGRPTSVEYWYPTADDNGTTADDELGEPHTVTTRFTRNGTVYQQVYPAIAAAGYAIETVTTQFNLQGMPNQLSGIDMYTDLVEYDDIGRPVHTILGTTGSVDGFDIVTAYNNSDGRLQFQRVNTGNGATLVQRDTYTHDPAGNPTAIQHDNTSTANDETECYTYDTRQRLNSARTIAGLANCTGQPTAGPAPFDNTYTSDTLHRITNFDGYSRSYNTTIATGSCNAGTNATKPHAINVSFISGQNTQFAYDCNGAITTQTITGVNPGTATYTWDRHQRLATVTNAAGTTTNGYDTTNNRVLRVDPDGTRTVYIPGTEIRWTSSNGVDAARSYGQTRREYDNTLTHYATNHQGSITATNSPGPSSDAIIRYEPYGTTRDTFPGAITNLEDHNFLGQPDDPNTPTIYLNNRHYLPQYGVFTSVDPIMIRGEPATLNPYVYSRGNPITLSDSSGLIGVCADGRVFGGSRYTAAAQARCNAPDGSDPDVTDSASPPSEQDVESPLPHYRPRPENPDEAEASDAAAEMANSETPPDSWLWMIANQCLYRPGVHCASHIDTYFGAPGFVYVATTIVVVVRYLGPGVGYRVYRYYRSQIRGPQGPTEGPGPQPESPPNFADPARSPGEGWVWRGTGQPGSNQGSWFNPATNEYLHPDLHHPGPIGPHFDWRAPDGNLYRIFPNGTILPK